jgi:putative ABC transport system permease protein
MSGGGGSMLPIDVLNKIRQVDGVSGVNPGVELALKEPNPDDPMVGGASMGPPPTIEGIDAAADSLNKNWQTMEMKEGKMLDKDSKENEIAVGYSIATENKLKIGDNFKIRGRDFKVVGILEKTMTGPDSYVMMSIKPAREMYIEANPFLKSLKQRADDAAKISDAELAKLPASTREQIMQAKAFNIEDVTTGAQVGWKDGADSEVVVGRIKDQFKDQVMVLSPKKMGEEIDKASAMFNAIILGTAMLALIVGIFSITNTMIMSISERTKEIGIKKAIGASGRSIALEYTLEAGVISIVGGVVGAGLGALMALLVNQKMASKGAEIFLIEPSFLVEVVAFSFIIGIIAGIIPAMRASKLRVVEAIREL